MEKTENKKMLIGVSGGPDSMALLEMARQNGLSIGVCHVNYHKRKESDKEMEYVKSYCDVYSIPCYILNEPYTYNGNFQAWAREYRYSFFDRIAKENGYDGILIAHQEDDLLETYLMQKKKNLTVETYGLAPTMFYHDLWVVRPLLDFTKEDLEDYCKEKGITYFIDSSNLSDDYTRNQIRHHEISALSLEERESLLRKIKEKNDSQKELIKKVASYIEDNRIGLKEYFTLNQEERVALLRYWIKKNHSSKGSCSASYFIQLDQTLKKEGNTEIDLDNCVLLKQYEVCEIVGKQDKAYSFVLKSLHSLETPYFTVKDCGDSLSACTVCEEDFPLTIRSYAQGDSIHLRFGHKKINRFFIDRKISLVQRETWPIVVNQKGSIILVPGIGCDVAHYSTKPNLFVVK